MGPAKMASNPTVPPMAGAAAMLMALLSVATAMMTNMSMKVRTVSRP